MTIVSRLWAWRRTRAERRAARELLREARWIGKRKRVSAAQSEKLGEAAARLERAIAARDAAQIAEARRGVDALVDGELAFARKSRVRAYAESLGGAVFVALFLRAFVVEAYQIPSGSMIPTLEVGDRIFVNKFIHGVRVPFTHWKIATDLTPVQRGEVIVFVHPKEPGTDLIKRVVAVAGDTVELRDDVVFVNGVASPRTPMSGDCTYHDFDEQSERWETRGCRAYREAVGGAKFTTFQEPGAAPRSFGPVQVPAGHVFVLGDNRDHSSDSRYWGFVPDELIEGKAMFVWFSYGEPDGVRLRRIGHPVR